MLKEISKGKLVTIIVLGVVAICSTLYYSVSNILFYNKTGQLAGASFSYGVYGTTNNTTSYTSKYNNCISAIRKKPHVDCWAYSDTQKSSSCTTTSINTIASSTLRRAFVLNDVMIDYSNNFDISQDNEKSFYAILNSKTVVSHNRTVVRVNSVDTYESKSSEDTANQCKFNFSFVDTQLKKRDVQKVAFFHVHPPHPKSAQQPSPQDFRVVTNYVNGNNPNSKFVNYVVEKDYVIQYWVDRTNTTVSQKINNFITVSDYYVSSFGRVCYNNNDYYNDYTTAEDDKLFCANLSRQENIDNASVTESYNNTIRWLDTRRVDPGETESQTQTESEQFYNSIGLRTHKWTKDEFKRLTIKGGFYPDARTR